MGYARDKVTKSHMRHHLQLNPQVSLFDEISPSAEYSKHVTVEHDEPVKETSRIDWTVKTMDDGSHNLIYNLTDLRSGECHESVVATFIPAYGEVARWYKNKMNGLAEHRREAVKIRAKRIARAKKKKESEEGGNNAAK